MTIVVINFVPRKKENINRDIIICRFGEK